MPVQHISVEGFEAFKEKLSELERDAKDKSLIVLFSGSKTKEGEF